MNFIKGLLPSKYIIVLILALAAGLVFFYQRNEINAEKVKSIQVELKSANEKIETQNTTIANMARDHKVEVDLMKKSQALIDVIRQKTIEDLKEISNTDFGKEANSNAPALEKVINERTKLLLNNIENISRQGLKR